MAYLRLPLLDCCTALSLCRQATLHKNREFQLKPGQLVLDVLRTVVGSSCKRHILCMNIENIQQNMELLSSTQPQHCWKHNYLNTVATRRVQTFGGNLVYCLAYSRLGTASISPGERIHPHHTHTHTLTGSSVNLISQDLQALKHKILSQEGNPASGVKPAKGPR